MPHGTTFSFNSKAVGGLVSITVPERTRGEAETTASDASWNRTFIPGLRDSGTIEITFMHDPADQGQQELKTNLETDGSGAVKTCVLTLPSDAGATMKTYTFQGYVSKTPSGTLALADNTAAQLSASIRVCGAVAVT